jgi:phenylpropionate dioxygenase-like ring-hydroxylating dioxygenase large terminal subunit
MTETVVRDVQRGFGNADRPLTKDLWARDSREPNLAMLEPGNFEPVHDQVDFARYYDRDFFKQELAKVWLKTWLFACREEDIPEVGDRVPFEVGPYSFLIVRSGEDEFKAFYNSCLHRGTKLCSVPGAGSKIACPYHAWEWNIDGSLAHIPSHWDFPMMNRANGSLRGVHLDRWGGFIFINADPDAPPLAAALSVIPAHFKDYAIEKRYTAARYRKLVGANWKLAQEAFMESYHVYGTHPAAVPYNGDSQSQYDIWDDEFGHVGRQVTPSAVPSMHAGPEATTLAAVEVYAAIMKSWHYPDAEPPVFDPAKDLRAQAAEWHRSVQTKLLGRKIDAPDAVMIDSLLYFMFPHFTVWLSESLPFTYQFTPHKSDPELSWFDVRMLLPCPEDAPRPPAAAPVDVAIDELIADKVPEFGFLAAVFDQDMANMPLVQAGVRTADPSRTHSQLSLYQERIIQHSNEILDRYMAR